MKIDINAFAIILLGFITPAHAEDIFFDSASPKERARFEQSIETMTKSLDALDDMSIIFQYDAFRKGDCKAFLEVESKAKAGDRKCK